MDDLVDLDRLRRQVMSNQEAARAADELASLRALKAKVDKAAEPVNRPSHWCDKPYADGWNQCLDWLRGGSDG